MSQVNNENGEDRMNEWMGSTGTDGVPAMENGIFIRPADRRDHKCQTKHCR